MSNPTLDINDLTPDQLAHLAEKVSEMQGRMNVPSSHQSLPGNAIQINRASGFAREMCKWETTHTEYGPPGRLPGYDHNGRKLNTEYPRAMFKFGHPKDENGVVIRAGAIVMEDTRDVFSDVERENLEHVGFRASQEAAIDFVKDMDREMARAEAIGNYQDRNMSERAKAEREDALLSSASHVAEIPRANAKTGVREVK